MLSSRTIGGLGVFLAPFFPDATMLITSFNNLSIYWQKGSMRRLMKDEPEYNRIATYCPARYSGWLRGRFQQ
ncbi:hypothetical protein CJU65_27595 [Escherichia coli]|nr:hypothetical protein CJU65_27595 [Escherichia coli]